MKRLARQAQHVPRHPACFSRRLSLLPLIRSPLQTSSNGRWTDDKGAMVGVMVNELLSFGL
jgi:hypothetical protein